MLKANWGVQQPNKEVTTVRVLNNTVDFFMCVNSKDVVNPENTYTHTNFKVPEPHEIKQVTKYELLGVHFPNFIHSVVKGYSDAFRIQYKYPPEALQSVEPEFYNATLTFEVRLPPGFYDQSMETIVELLNLIMSRGVWHTDITPNPSTTNTGLVFISSSNLDENHAPTPSVNLLRRVRCSEHQPFKDFTSTTHVKNIKSRKLYFWLERLNNYDTPGTLGEGVYTKQFGIDEDTMFSIDFNIPNSCGEMLGVQKTTQLVSTVTPISDSLKVSEIVLPSYFNRVNNTTVYLCSDYLSKAGFKSRTNTTSLIPNSIASIPIDVPPGEMVRYRSWNDHWYHFDGYRVHGDIDFELKDENGKVIDLGENGFLIIKIRFMGGN